VLASVLHEPPRSVRLALAVCVVAIAALGIVSASTARAATAEVEIFDYGYKPAKLQVDVGTAVTWTNTGSQPHTVTSSDGGPLDSPTLHQGDSWSYTFSKPGTYAYYCSIHPDMVASVTVVDPHAGHDGSTTSTTAMAPSSTTTTTEMAMEPSSSTTTTTTRPSSSSPGSPAPCPQGGVSVAFVEPFWRHFQTAHLERSPSGQASDALDVDQYVKTHTMLLELMLDPVVMLAIAAPRGIEPFWHHFETAHLERSPSDQVSDLLNVSQYTKTHTVLLEHMLAPAVGAAVGC